MPPTRIQCSPRSVLEAALLHHHSHDRVLVRPPAFLVHSDDLIDADVADEIARDEDKVGSDDSMRVDVTHGVARRERLFCSNDGYDLYTGAWSRPFGVAEQIMVLETV